MCENQGSAKLNAKSINKEKQFQLYVQVEEVESMLDKRQSLCDKRTKDVEILNDVSTHFTYKILDLRVISQVKFLIQIEKDNLYNQ